MAFLLLHNYTDFIDMSHNIDIDIGKVQRRSML